MALNQMNAVGSTAKPLDTKRGALKFALVRAINSTIVYLIFATSLGQNLSLCEGRTADGYEDEIETKLGSNQPLVFLPSELGERPKLIPLVAAESGYSENSSVNILCTVSQGHHDTLTFDWFKDGQVLDKGNHNEQQGGEELGSNLAPQIEKHSDHSLLRISRVHSQHSGRYTCSAKNQFGQDSSSVNLIVNGNYISRPTSTLSLSPLLRPSWSSLAWLARQDHQSK